MTSQQVQLRSSFTALSYFGLLVHVQSIYNVSTLSLGKKYELACWTAWTEFWLVVRFFIFAAPRRTQPCCRWTNIELTKNKNTQWREWIPVPKTLHEFVLIWLGQNANTVTQHWSPYRDVTSFFSTDCITFVYKTKWPCASKGLFGRQDTTLVITGMFTVCIISST